MLIYYLKTSNIFKEIVLKTVHYFLGDMVNRKDFDANKIKKKSLIYKYILIYDIRCDYKKPWLHKD